MNDKINNLPNIRDTLQNNHIIINKSLGQNFLFDLNLTDKIVKNSKSNASTMIEIGPGPGGLTRSIVKIKSGIVYTVDKDLQSEKMLKDLKKIYKDRLNVIIDDALHYPIWKLGSKPRQVIANLPYNISTKILIILLKNINNFQKLNLMFQKEVALRIVAKPGEKFYGRLSVLAQLLTRPKILFDLPNTVFTPRPKVESSLVEFIPLKKPMYRFNVNNIEKITHITFSKRRKMLRSILKKHGGEKLLIDLGICPIIRPENLTLNEFCILSEKLFNKK